MMVGKVTVDLAKKFRDITAETPKQFGCEFTGDAITAVHHDAQGACRFHILGNAREISIAYVFLQELSLTVRKIVLNQSPTQILDSLAGKGFAAKHHLEAVVFRRVVTAGDGDAGIGAEIKRREVEHRCRHAADIDHVATGTGDAARERGDDVGTGEAAVAAYCHLSAATLERLAADGVADTFDDRRRQRLADDAADIVGLEDFRRVGCRQTGGRGLGMRHGVKTYDLAVTRE